MEQTFTRNLDELHKVFIFLDTFAEASDVDMSVSLPVRLAVEELFTNMVKYNKDSRADITLSIDRSDDEVKIVLTDFDTEPFDITSAGDVDITASLDERTPGGLGIHLVKRMVDEIHYRYKDRVSQITLIKSVKPRHA
ncbi:MAG: ATP-binding protein [Rhodothermales bacterium]|jgi:anti-sigma regulatory factor (Ser/Thr protein kinase)